MFVMRLHVFIVHIRCKMNENEETEISDGEFLRFKENAVSRNKKSFSNLIKYSRLQQHNPQRADLYAGKQTISMECRSKWQ